MELIGHEELREKLARGDDVKLVMTLPAHAFRMKHIPGSVHVETRRALARLDPSDEIVLYCAGVYCPESIYAYHFLSRRGYSNVRRFAGGIAAWEEAGYPVAAETSGSEDRAQPESARRKPVGVTRRVALAAFA